MGGSKIEDPLLVYDFDYIIYKSAFAGEKRTIEAEHLPTGRLFKFKNRTEMWGRGKKIGGWLAEENLSRESRGEDPLTKDDFIITDVQSAEPIANVLHTVKNMVESPMEDLGAKRIVGFIGGKEKPLWRWERATLLEYKGNRKESLAPIYKQEVIDFLKRRYGAIEVNDGLEADDHVIISAYEDPKAIVTGVDKDVLGNPVYSFNPYKPEEGIIDGRGFGEIFWNPEKKEVRGYGRKFFYWQWLHGDPVDNYKANCFSDVEWGEKSAFDALEYCATDVDCYETIRDCYRNLYPKAFTVEGWRGDKIVIDWLYVANEIWDMARMWRWEGDVITAKTVLEKHKII